MMAAAAPRRPTLRYAWAVGAALMCAGLIALGCWQLWRLQWKLALIDRVDRRVHAAAVAAPGPDRWPQLTAETDEYRRVRVDGRWLPELATRVQASTELGSGFWLLTPLCRADGSIVLVNRGFVEPAAADRKPAPPRHAPGDACSGATPAPASVSGLLRMSEPGGGFLRHNDPAGNRWYSRDVAAIASARGLRQVAPYFIDADASAADGAPGQPVGGLTVISFHNNHLVYALTWFALALMSGGACVLILRDKWKRKNGERD
jgi:surfeit locus 1 family protein